MGVSIFSILAMPLSTTVLAGKGGLWTSAGQNRSNTRYAKTESKISPANVGNLDVKWVFETGGDVSATPAVDGKAVYVPDWAGNLFKIDRKTGALIWSRQISEYTGIASVTSLATPRQSIGTCWCLVIRDRLTCQASSSLRARPSWQ